jgi:cell division protein FtsB|tara:strand:+ start:840 stop:1760 length:921 start_codon:yes stop_codon:yes gene_type:complete
MERSKNFHIYLGIAALLIAGSAAFFSVFGLSKLFAGAALSVIIMAGSLEFGKLVTAAFLYRYWDKVNIFQKTYLMTAVITLVLITSAGIFGYLSNAYQGATVTFEKQSNQLLAYEDRLEQLQEDKSFLKEELEVQVNDLPENYITAKRKLREDYNPRIQSVNDEILDVKGKIGDLKVSLVETGVDVGPAIYLARTFGTDVDSVVKFFIFILIFVFDPLAVMLVVAFNQALLLREENEPSKDSNQVNLITKKAKSWWKFWEMYGEEKPKVKESVPIYQPTGFRALEDDEDEEVQEEKIVKKGGVKIV